MIKEKKVQLTLHGGNSLEFLRCLLESEIEWESSCPKILDLSQVFFVTPIVCVWVKYFTIKNWKTLKPYSYEASQYLEWMNIYANQNYGDQRYIPTFHLVDASETNEVRKRLLDIFKNWMNKETREFLSYSISELMENVFFHAKSEEGLVIHVQKYGAFDNRIEACIVDFGQGIANSMAENPEFRERPEEQRFIAGLTPRCTSKPGRHTGEGLSSVLEWIKQNDDAQGVIISQNCVWGKLKRKDEKWLKYNLPKWPGTLIWMSFPRDSRLSLNSVWEKLGFSL
ncbi:MAG: hypothetical protein LWW94_00635 [Candidatus Desulfofervidaceae bacterium]|nr:hypothetical protein [Candidatus Desulfofervidaceae bacterium]